MDFFYLYAMTKAKNNAPNKCADDREEELKTDFGFNELIACLLAEA